MNQELFKKHVCNQSNHYEKYDGAVCPGYRLKLKYPLSFSVSYVQLLHSSTNQELFEKHSCNQVATMKNTDDFSLRKGSHHIQLSY